jgi:hypothetical protein
VTALLLLLLACPDVKIKTDWIDCGTPAAVAGVAASVMKYKTLPHDFEGAGFCEMPPMHWPPRDGR